MMVYFGTKYDVRRRTSGRQGVKVMTTRLGKAASFKRSGSLACSGGDNIRLRNNSICE